MAVAVAVVVAVAVAVAVVVGVVVIESVEEPHYNGNEEQQQIRTQYFNKVNQNADLSNRSHFVGNSPYSSVEAIVFEHLERVLKRNL